MTEEQDSYKVQTTNQPFIEPNVLALRLETTDLLDRIETFLSGERTAFEKDRTTGKIQAMRIKISEPLCNRAGAVSLVNWLGMQMNPSTVQGNIEISQYYDILARTRKELAKILLVNAPMWAVKRSNRKLIMSGVMNELELFMSRPIANKERESYSTSLSVRGSSVTKSPEDKKRFW